MTLCAKCGAIRTHRFVCDEHPLNRVGSSGVGTHVGSVGPERIDEIRRLRKEVSELNLEIQQLRERLVDKSRPHDQKDL